MSYDVFISYRRKGAGAGVAGELQAKLENRGYKVFLDVDNIGSGDFPEQIDDAIRECNDFLLILSPGMLDRCVDEGDWVRHEIQLAEQCGKNIVGVSLPGFSMPEAETLPLPLRDLPEKQVFLWSHEYRNASFTKIEENLLSFRQKKQRKHRYRIGVLGVALAAVLGAVVWQLMSSDSVAQVVEEDPFVAVAKEARKAFGNCVKTGDSLLQSVPNPTKPEEFSVFMTVIARYDSALSIAGSHPELSLDSIGLADRVDSLNRLRKERLTRELDAASMFLGVDQLDFARYRFNNAKVLAIEEDRSKLESLERRLKD